jgi:prepilin-type N-terminal cleavage/methylation domain-containing protein
MKHRNSPGFTLVEMAVVLLILSLLAGSLSAGCPATLPAGPKGHRRCPRRSP